MSSAGFKKLGVAPCHWQHIQQLSGLRSFTAASIAPRRCDHQRHVAAQAGLQGGPTASQSADAAAGAPVAAYVHLPFCKRKCFYCDFPVEAVGLNVQKTRTQDRMTAYVDLVCAEIRATHRLNQQPLQTVSFGGGTPSLIPPHLLERILTTLQQQYDIAADAEISLEADPGTFDLQRLQQYKSLGVNRLSMGVQCFNQELLQTCGRSHSLEDVYTAIDAVKAVGFPSWSLDLISGLPKLTLGVWRHSLDEAVAAGPNHISIYDLQIEQGTPFARWYSGQGSPLPQEPEAVAMFEAASATLTAANYKHYEISNYAQAGHRSRHNQVYWNCQPYYAFGLGSASYACGKRFSRPRVMAEYKAWVGGYVASGAGCPAADVPTEGQEDRLLDLIMLQLRLSDGLDLQQLQQQFGQHVVVALLPVIHDMMQKDLMQLVPDDLQHQPVAGRPAQHTTAHGLHQRTPAEGGWGSPAAAVKQSAQKATAAVELSTQRTTAVVGSGDVQGGVDVLQERLRLGLQCRVRLTDPRGFLLSNDVIAELFAVLEPSMLTGAGVHQIG